MCAIKKFECTGKHFLYEKYLRTKTTNFPENTTVRKYNIHVPKLYIPLSDQSS